MSQSSRSKRNGDDEMSGTRRRSDSTPSSTSKRKSSKRNDPDRDGGFNPISTSFSSTSQTPYPGIAAPSVASSYATANTTNPMNRPYRPPDLIRNESMTSQRAISASEPARESRKKRDSDTRRERSSDSDNNNKASRRSKRSDKDERRRSSRKDDKPKRTDSERALDNHRASMVENQFPGEFPSTFAEPYRPPGLAAEYYGDQGESVAEQPGVRPAPPSIITNASQAHLHEATIEAAPPPEPSSLGLVGAAASFYAGTTEFGSDSQSQPSKPTSGPGSKPKRRSTYGVSPRSSPGPQEEPGSVQYSATGVGPATSANAGVGGTVRMGQAAEYFSTQFRPDLTEGGPNMAPSGNVANQSMQTPIQGIQASTQGSIRPPLASQKPSSQKPSLQNPSSQNPSSGSNMPLYGAAAAGIAAVGAGAYYAGHHTTEEHHSMDNLAAGSYGPQNTGHSSSLPQNFQSQPSMQQRRRRRGPFAKIVDFFQDPTAVAEYEVYTEAIGVCKYCFDPGSSPRDAPRKHHYNSRSSDARYGSSARVDKLNRYPSSEDEKRRRSNDKKWVATGLAGYGLAKMSEAAANRRNGFDDTYSVKSGRPEASTRVSFAADERGSSSRKTKHSSGDDKSYSRQNSRRDGDIRIRKDRKTGQLYEERSSRRRRDSSTSDRFSKGAAVSTGVAAGSSVAAAGHRSRSNSPKKRYYSKRVSPNHSYVDLSTTNSATLGFGSFFSSPSANRRKGKKPKGLGLFNFTNASSSSSDADLAFGAGSVRRKRNRRNDRKARDDGIANAEILGLAATGVALAAERNKEDRKGKRRADLMVVKEPRGDPSRRRDKRYLHSPPSQSDELHDDWIDESDGKSSVDSALAYGGGLSARQSRESLASSDGTDKWDWRWNRGKKPRKKPSLDPSRFEPAALGLAGAAAASSGRYGPAESNASLQSLQQLDPVPMPDSNAFEVDRKASAISSLTGMAPPVLDARTEAAPLRHPQPITPVSPAVYSRQGSAPPPVYNPNGTPVFSQYPPQAPMTESPKQLPVDFQTQRPRSDEKPRKRRNSSPTPSQTREDEFDDSSRRRMSTRDSVKFDLTEEQIERDRRAQRRERRRSERKGRSSEKLVESTNFEQEASLERERDEISSSRRSSTEARTAREQEIERELERLYEEDRQQKEARKSKRADTWPAAAAIGAGVAGFAAVAAAESASLEDEAKPEREERQSRRKSALKQTTPSKMGDDDRSDSQQRRIARMAAARVSAKPSPVHDDYASYFVPPELADKVKEHNFAAQHRDDPIEQPAQIVEVAPRTARRKDTFDPFLYRPFGIEPEDDPRQFSWPVPLLDIIEPTPPVSVRGDMSPLSSKTPEPPEVPELPEEMPEKRQKRSSSVTWGEHRTHEYEVITPLEDHEGFVRTTTHESSQPAIDLAESTYSDVKPELSELVSEPVGSNGMPLSTAENDVPAPAPVVQEQEQKSNYGQDLEFAAILAAGTEHAGFDPAIVVNDPTYHRRDSPPGSEAGSFYRAPYAETVSDIGSFHDYSVPPQKGFVEGEIPLTPAEGVPKGLELMRSEDSRTAAEEERIDVEPKIPGGFNVNVFDYLEDSPTVSKSVNVEATQEPMAVSLGEEDEKLRKSENILSETHILPAESVISVQSDPGKKLNRSATLDDVSFDKSLDQSGPQVSYASDPEDFGEKRSKKSKKLSRKSGRAAEAAVVGAAATAVPIVGELRDPDRGRRKLEREDDDYYERLPPVSASEPGADTSEDPRRSSWKPKRDSDIWDDTKSTISSPAELRDDREGGKKSKKKSRRDSPSADDDVVSVTSLPANLNGDKSASRKSKDKKSGSLFGWFSSSKSETSTSPKRSSGEMDLPSRNGHDMMSEGLDDPKRRSKRKSRDKDDVSSDLYRSRSHSQPSVKNDLRQESPEDEFLSSEETTRDNERREDGISFLGERPELPTVLDGGSGSKAETLLDTEQGISAEPPPMPCDPVSSIVRSRSISPRTIPAIVDEHVAGLDEATSPSARRDQFRQRHLSEIRTNDVLSSPAATSSPTAVPLHFRRLPVSPSFVRSASVGSTSTGSPVAPLTTPRTKQGRPTSTEFRNSKEFRPLYLVERHSSTKQPELEVEETYPSLPSSRTSSAHPSMENLRGDDQGELYAEQQMSPSQARDNRHSISYWRDERPTSPDYLDSRTATPTATEFPKEVKREKPKYEFHSPSELLQDLSSQPAGQNVDHSPSQSPMVLPSVGSPASSVAKDDSSKHSSRPSSPARDQRSVDDNSLAPSIGLGLVGGAAAALTASQLFEHEEDATVTAEEPLHMGDNQDLSETSAASTTSLDQLSRPVDPPTMRELEAAVAPQAADEESTVLSVSRKKSKKDKKKKRKTLDLRDESIEGSSSSLDAPEVPDNVDPLGTKAITEPRPASQVNVQEQVFPSEITISDIAVLTQPKHDVLDTQAPASTKRADVGDLDIPTTGHVGEQPLPQAETGKEVPFSVEDMTDSEVPAEKPSEKAAEEDDGAFDAKELDDKVKEFGSITRIADPEIVQPVLQDTDKSSQNMAVDKSSVAPDKDVTTPKSPSLSGEKIETQIPRNKESMPAPAAELVQQDRDLSSNPTFEVLDDTDHTEGLDEKVSRDSYPFDEPTATLEVDTATLSGPSPLEEAFAKAKAARGTAPEISEEEAFQAFQPPASLEPWHGSGRLETIVESSREGSKVDVAQLEEAVENVGGDQGLPSRSKSKKDKKKDKTGKKSKISTEVEVMEAEPDDTARDNVAAVTQSAQEETEIVTDPLLSVESINAITISDPSINPFGNDYVLTREDNIDDKPVDTSRELENADASQHEDSSAAATPLELPEQAVNASSDLHELVEESSWALTSKKDKKKGKKGRTTALISDASTPVTEMSSTESIDQPRAGQLDIDSSAVSTKRGKKGKKEKKKSQVLDFAAEDESGRRKTMQEDGLEQPVEPTQKASEIEQDASTQETADVIVFEGKKGKKSKKKKNQAVDWMNEATTPQTEESVDATAESQRDISIGEAETEDLTWATTKKSKKDKKGSRKLALREETLPQVDVAQSPGSLPIPVPLEEPVSALNNDPPMSVPGVLDEVSLPRDEASIPTEASIPQDEASVPRDEDQLPPHNHETSEAVEAKQLSVPDLVDQHVSGAFEEKESPESQVIHELSEPRKVEPQTPEPVEAPTPVPHSTDEHKMAMVQDTLKGSEPKDVPWQTAKDREDEEAKALRDLRWTSVFGELKQRKVPQSTEAPRRISEVADGHEMSAVRASSWASVFGELKERTTSKATREDDQLVPVREVKQEGHLPVLAGEGRAQMSVTDLEQQRQASVPVGGDQEQLPAPSLGQSEQASAPAEVDQQTNTLQAGTELPARTESKQEQIPEQTHESAPEQLLPSQAVPPEHIQDGQQAHRADLEDKSSQMVSSPIVVAEGVRDQSRHLVHDQAPQEAQEPAVKSLPQPEPEWQEATSSDSGMTSDGRLGSDSHEDVQPQSTLQIERSGEAGVTAEARHEVALPEPSSQVEEPVEADVTVDSSQEVTLPEPSSQVEQPVEADITTDTSYKVALTEPSSQAEQLVKADVTADASHEAEEPIEADINTDAFHKIALPEPSSQIEQPVRADIPADASHEIALPESSSRVEQPVKTDITADTSHEVALLEPSSQAEQPVEAGVATDAPREIALPEPSSQVEQPFETGIATDASHEIALPDPSSQVEEPIGADTTTDASHEVALPEPSSQVEQPFETGIATDASHEIALPEPSSQVEEPIGADATIDVSREVALPEPSSQIEQSVTADLTADAFHEVALTEPSSQVEQPVEADVTTDAAHEIALPEPPSQTEESIKADTTTDASHEVALLESPSQIGQSVKADLTADASHEVALTEPPSQVKQPVEADVITDAAHEIALPEPLSQIEESVKADTTTDASHEVALPEPSSQIEQPAKADLTADASHEVALTESSSQVEQPAKTDVTTGTSHEAALTDPSSQIEQLVQAGIITDTSHEVALPETSSQVKQLTEADVTADAPSETVQPKVPLEIERPDEPETITDPSPTPTQMIENQADEVSQTPTQKGKKDKKSKKSKSKQSTINELTEPSTELSRSNDVLPDSVVAVASIEGTETPATATPAEGPSTEADEFSWAPAKKSKKDKRKKKSLAFAKDPSTPASDNLNKSRSSIPRPETLAHLSNDVGAERLTSDEKQAAKDVGTENEIQSPMADMSNLPKQVEDFSLTPPMSEEQQTALENDETIKAGPEHDAAQRIGGKVFVTEPEEMQEEPGEYSLATTPKEGKMDENKQVSTLEASGPPTSQIEDEPPSAQDTVDPAATPRAGTTEEDEWAFSTKKSKRDKKKRESTMETSQLITPKVQDELSVAEDTMVPATTPKMDPTEEDKWTFSTTKGKKDKKKKKAALTSVEDVTQSNPEEDMQASRDTSPPVEPEIDREIIEQPHPDMLAIPIVEQKPEEQAVGSSPELAKAETVGSATERELTSGVSESQINADHVEEQPVIANKSAFGDESAMEDKPIVAMEEDSSWAPAPKQSKKDKKDKKKRKPTVVLEEPLEGSSSSVNATDSGKNQTIPDHMVVDEPSPTSEPDRAVEAETNVGTRTAVEPGANMEEDVSMAAEIIEESQHSSLVELEGPAEDDSWAFTTKKSKDKKKNRQTKVSQGEPATENMDSMASAAAVGEDITEEEKQPLTELSDFNATPEAETHVAPVSNSPDLEERTGETEPVVELQEDAQAFTIKKSKKEKKAKRTPAIDSEEGITGAISASAAAVAAATAAVDRTQRDAEQSQERWPGLGEPREAETAPRSSSEHLGLPESAKEVGAVSEHTESIQKLEQVGEPSEDTWGFSTKNKKDKKKKRKSTFDDYHSTSSAPPTPSERTQADQDMVVPANEQARDLTSEKNEIFEPKEPALAIAEAPPSQVVEDDFPPIRKKKSKKDKEKRALLSWSEENDASAEQTTETSTPANEPELGKFGEQEPTLYASQETIKTSEAKSVDFDPSRIQESAAGVEGSLPAVQQHFNFTEHPVVHPALADTRELASAGDPVEPKDDGDWGFSSTKKGKKTKKANKGVADSPVAAAGDERQDIDSRDDSESRSLRLPGSFEDESQSGPQARDVPEIESIKEERNVQSMTEVSRASTDVATTSDEVEFTTKSSKKGKKGKKGNNSFYLSSDDARPTEAVSEQTLAKDYARDQGQIVSIGLGNATIAAQAAASQDTEYRNLSNEDEPPSQHEASRDAVNDQAISHQEEQHGRALPLSDRSPELPTAPEAPETRPFQSSWSFANLKQDSTQEHANRDSGIQVSDSPLIQAGHIPPTVRDSGYVPSPVAPASRESSVREESSHSVLARPPRPISPTSSFEDLRQKAHDHSMRSQGPGEIDDVMMYPSGAHGFRHNLLDTPSKRQPSPVDSTTKDRSSALFNSSPSNRTDAYGATPRLDTRHIQSPVTDLHRSPSVHGHGHRSREDLRSLTPSRSPTRHLQQTSDAPIGEPMQEVSQQPHRSIFGPFPTGDEHDRGLSPPRTPLQTIHEHVIDTSPSNRVRRHLSDVGSPGRAHTSVGRSSAPDLGRPAYRLDTEHPIDAFHTQVPPGQPSAVESEREAQSVADGNHGLALAEVAGLTGVTGAAAIVGLGGVAGAAAIADEELRPSSRDEKIGDAKSLGKSKSRSTSSKQLRRSQVSLENIASSSTHDPVREKGKAAARDMADVYNGYGEFPGAPMSPTRPPSVRKRQSMQQIKDLEARLDQLVSENRLLATAKINAEQQLQDVHFAQSRADHASQEALELRDVELREKDEAIAKMREALDALQKEVARLTEVNEGLMATHEEMRSTHEQRYSQLEEQHAETHQQWQESSRELEDLRSKHTELSTGMEEIVQHELDTRLAEKDAEIHRLYDELEDAKAKIRELQQQILVGQSDEVIVVRDEDYFDNACQQLCQHVQQWVLRFSKFSDTRICRLTREVRDEKIVDRFENAILDGSDVDIYLADRVKRRDVFMSVVMTMIWEYIFTRYLFGMDREQRQKLKQLEKNLNEVGPPSSVHRWRAMTLTLLSKRESFKGQRASDTEAVVQEIYSTLARFLPPPQALQGQIQESLRNVMKAAVDLSIEMRTQRAEYIMLPPLQPEYDLNGDLARKVYFNAALMNERSGETTSNDELEAEQAVVRMVLFPLVVKKGSDTGEGDEEIVVCPAQVLVARSGKDKKAVRVLSGDRMSIDQASRSVQSFAPSVLDPANVI